MHPKITLPLLLQMKQKRQPITTLTCYDYTTAKILDEAGVDILLIGDSLGMVKLGLSSTLPVTVEDMLYHTRIIARATSRPLIVTDMPYLSYQVSAEAAVQAAGSMLKEGAHAVKIEGGQEMVPILQALRRAKIPVMGHIGMTPQSVHLFGGFKVQGRIPKDAQRLVADAKALEKAGAFAIVLECVPSALAQLITRRLSIPTIGIGAGPHCDGQVLVIDDVLGLTSDPLPRFVKRYAELKSQTGRAVRAYLEDVRTRRFPDDAHSYH